MASRMEARVATTGRTSAPVMVRMSSMAKTFDGSAMATTQAAFGPADGEGQVAAGQAVADQAGGGGVDRVIAEIDVLKM